MVRRYKTVTKQEQVLYSESCDFCGKPIRSDKFELEKVSLSNKVGSCFPEGGSGTLTYYDCCQGCWTNKILPKLTKMALTPPHMEPWEY